MRKICLFIYLLALSATLTLLSGCASTGTAPQLLKNQFTQPPQYYLQQADANSGLERQNYLLQATAAAFYYGDFAAGRQSLYRVNVKSLDTDAFANYQLLNARLAIHDKQDERAIAILNNLAANPNTKPEVQAESLRLRAQAQLQMERPIDSIRSLIALTPLLTNPTAKDDNQQQIWHILGSVPSNQLQQLANDDSEMVLQGWAALALITRQYGSQSQLLVQQLKYWQSQYPNHPALPMVSTDIQNIGSGSQNAKQVAVLLPLQGPTSAQAQAVLNGFLSGYYLQLQHNMPTPQIKVYDSSQGNIGDVYKQAIEDGAQFVIGPLTKSNVDTLADDDDISVPTLALNYSSGSVSIPNKMYEFALSPIDEAQNAAMRAAELGYQNAVTITPKGTWGETIATAFADSWQAYQRTLVASLAFDPNQALRNQISKLLNIDQSYWRHRQLQKLLGISLSFSARRRQDIDVIFLNSFPDNARQILPLLRFYYAGDIPVYATSQIYSGVPNPSKDRDLNGVRFTIMPWSINPSSEAKQLQQISSRLWPKNYRQNSKLYAFGSDAYLIMSRMGQLQAFSKFGLKANTGTLFLTPQHKIIRQTEWAEFVDGAPKLLKYDSNVIIPLQESNPETANG